MAKNFDITFEQILSTPPIHGTTMCLRDVIFEHYRTFYRATFSVEQAEFYANLETKKYTDALYKKFAPRKS